MVGNYPVKADCALIRVDDVQEAIAKLLDHLSEEEDLPPAGVHPSAVVSDDAQLGEGVAVGAGVVVGSKARIGSGSVLCANVVIGSNVSIGDNVVLGEGVIINSRTQIGSRVRIGPNSVIGSDGFGYYLCDRQDMRFGGLPCSIATAPLDMYFGGVLRWHWDNHCSLETGKPCGFCARARCECEHEDCE